MVNTRSLWRPAYGICGKQAGSTRNRAYVATPFDQIDSMYVVGVYDAGTTDTSQDLGEDINGHFTPREVAASGKSDSDRGINMTARYTAGNPDAKRCAW